MALQSMTGFARSQGSHETANWEWEIKSVNGRGLDIRFRLPPGFDALEADLRRRVTAGLRRGNVQISLRLERLDAGPAPSLNRSALDAVIEASEEIAARTGLERPTVGELLAVSGVMDVAESAIAGDLSQDLHAGLITSFEEALRGLADIRRAEGKAIGKVLAGQVKRIGEITDALTSDPSRTPESIRARISEQLAQLIDATSELDPQRLHQEAAILAAKADLQEEIDRLRAHMEAAGKLLASGDAVGRKLDFLAQEFNRECNTICSKSNATTVTALGLEMKAVIDQFREQVQNLQ